MSDPALDTLLLPLATGAIAWPGRGLFLRARAGAGITVLPRDGLECRQSFKPFADALARAGYAVQAGEEGEQEGDAERFPLVLVLPPRQREEVQALLARALRRATPGGVVLAASTNTEGARSHEADLAALSPLAGSVSKNKARVFWTIVGDRVDTALADAWAGLDAPRPVADSGLFSRPGLFAWDRIDAGSALLAQHLPPDLTGRAADLGAGVGYLSAELLARCPGITALDLYEAEARALDLARINLRRETPPPAFPPLAFHWHDVTAGLPGRYEVIVSNPPFHVGRADDPGLGQGFIAAAADGLAPGGQLWLVANRHLPYEGLLASRFAGHRCVADQDGYKILHATGPKPAGKPAPGRAEKPGRADRGPRQSGTRQSGTRQSGTRQGKQR
jgi:16S rRNA (guanine1207-N2)-methyltransferase